MEDSRPVLTQEELELLEKISPEILQKLQENAPYAYSLAKIALNTRNKHPSPEEEANQPVIRLPSWPEPVRAVPNSVLRSALFGAIRKGRRRYMEREQIASLADTEIFYTGPRLDQGDLDVWESALHILRDKDLGTECRTTSYALLKLMGLKDTGGERQNLHKRITRLAANAVEIRQGRYCYIGGLLQEAFKDEETQEWVLVLNPHLRALFVPNQFTMIQWSIRRTLSGQPLAQWLHGFYSSHAAPLPIKVETLYKLSGSEAKELKHFTEKVKKALEAVERACAAAGEIFEWRIEGGLVYVKRTPSAAQRRHLARHGK